VPQPLSWRVWQQQSPSNYRHELYKNAIFAFPSIWLNKLKIRCAPQTAIFTYNMNFAAPWTLPPAAAVRLPRPPVMNPVGTASLSPEIRTASWARRRPSPFCVQLPAFRLPWRQT
jgi:hypothetical protein